MKIGLPVWHKEEEISSSMENASIAIRKGTEPVNVDLGRKMKQMWLRNKKMKNIALLWP